MKNEHRIRNEVAYFKKIRHNMFLKERNKQKIINENEVSIEDVSTFSNLKDNFDLDKELASCSLLGWIDMIEDQKLHAEVKSLPIEEQTLLSYIFEKDKTQTDVAKIYKIKQQSLCEKINKIINKLKHKM